VALELAMTGLVIATVSLWLGMAAWLADPPPDGHIGEALIASACLLPFVLIPVWAVALLLAS